MQREWCYQEIRATRNVLFNFQGAIKKIQPLNENWIPGLKNIQRVSCSFAASLCSHLFPLQESAGSLPAWQGSWARYCEITGLECGVWVVGGWGVLCSKAWERAGKERKWEENGLPRGQEASHKENRFGTSPQALAHGDICSINLQSHRSAGDISFANAALVNILIGSFCNRNSITGGNSIPGDLIYSRREGGCANQRENALSNLTDVANTILVLRYVADPKFMITFILITAPESKWRIGMCLF